MSFKNILLVMPSGRHGLGYSLDLIPTSLEYIASYIEEQVNDVNIIDLKMEKRPIDYFLRRFQPDLVGLSMCATEHSEGLSIAKKAKRLGMATAVGNYHPTGLPLFFATHPDIDFVVRGEGEESFLELIKKGDARGVLGVSYSNEEGVVHNRDRPFIKNLDTIPFPARHLRRHRYWTRNDSRMELDTLTISRGCHGQCTFCCEPSMNRGLQRYRSPENIIEEVMEIYEFHRRRPLTLLVTDPDVLGNAEIIEEFCDRLIPLEYDLQLVCHTRADNVVAFPGVVDKMVKAGFTTFEMGIESPDQKDLNSTKKNMGADLHKKACYILRRYGAHPLGTFVVGLPEHKEEVILDFPEYGKNIGLSKAAFGIATPFPGTEFYNELNKKGLIFEKDWNKFDEMHSVFDGLYLPHKRVEYLASRCVSKFWSIDQILDIENLEKRRKGKKISLFEFGLHIKRLMDVGYNAILQLQNSYSLQHVMEFTVESPDPTIEVKTRALKIHEIIAMEKFLKILGDQILEVTIDYKGQPLTSWILRLKNQQVDCIQVIRGEDSEATMHFRFDLAIYEKNPELSKAQKFFHALKFLFSPKGFSGKLNTVRLLLAIALG